MNHKMRAYLIVMVGGILIALNFAFAPLGPANHLISSAELTENEVLFFSTFFFILCPIGGVVLVAWGIDSLFSYAEEERHARLFDSQVMRTDGLGKLHRKGFSVIRGGARPTPHTRRPKRKPTRRAQK